MRRTNTYNRNHLIFLIYICPMSKESKTLSDFLSGQVSQKEIYTSDQERNKKRKNRGYYSRSSDCFDFIFLINNWENIVGKMLGENSIPQKLQKGTLIVITKHPVFNQELNMMSQDILEKIKEKIPSLKNHVKRIKFSNANYSANDFINSSKKKESNKPTTNGHKFSPEFRAKKAKANSLFEDIEDPEVKELLTNLFLKRF